MSKFIILGFLVFISFITLSTQQLPDTPTGEWVNIRNNDTDLVGLVIRGMNWINNYLRFSKTYRFLGCPGTPKKESFFGAGFLSRVWQVSPPYPTVECWYRIFHWPASNLPYYPNMMKEITYYDVRCNDNQEFRFNVTRPKRMTS